VHAAEVAVRAPNIPSHREPLPSSPPPHKNRFLKGKYISYTGRESNSDDEFERDMERAIQESLRIAHESGPREAQDDVTETLLEDNIEDCMEAIEPSPPTDRASAEPKLGSEQHWQRRLRE
jgi:hypothetical protein